MMRVGGALGDGDSENILWAFCGVMGGSSTHLSFFIVNGKCTSPTTFTLSDYCSDILGTYLVLSGELTLVFNPITPSLSDGDFEIMRLILKENFPSLVFDKIDVYDSNKFDGKYTYFLYIDMDLSGYGDARSEAAALEVYEYVLSQVKYIEEAGTLAEMFGNTAGVEQFDTNVLVSVTQAHLSSNVVNFGTRQYSKYQQLSPSDRNGDLVHDVIVVDKSDESVYVELAADVLKTEAIIGYILFSAFVVLLAIFVTRNTFKSRFQKSSKPEDSSSHQLLHDENVNVI